MTADRLCRWAIEAVVLSMALGAPWALGGTLPEAILCLQVGTALILTLWAGRTLLTGYTHFRADVVLAALAGLTLWAAIQLAPVPTPLLKQLAPTTLETNRFLRPEVREHLPGESDGIVRPTAFRLSLSPPDTNAWFVQLFTLTLLYAAVRSNLVGNKFLVRLAWGCALNGALLSVLGIAQLSNSNPSVVHWAVPTEGQVFGPFVNRNHFPFYAGPCLGLGCALLAGRFREGVGEFLRRPTGLWLAVFAGVTAAGLFLSHSRGGIVSALVAAAGCLLVWFRHSQRPNGMGWAGVTTLVAGAIVAWVGWSSVMAKLNTLDTGRLSDEVRMELWTGGLKTFSRYPLFGTGAGSFIWVEPAGRTTQSLENMTADHAHNEYVEALVEGGVVRLALTLLLVVGAVLAVVRRHRQEVKRSGGTLLLGGLFGVLMVAFESFVDFGVHLPAIAVLLVVLVAALLGYSEGRDPVPVVGVRVRLLPVALALMGAGGLIIWDGVTAIRAERCRQATRGLSARETLAPDEAARAVRLLNAACQARPGNAIYQHELGQAYLAQALCHPAGSPERTADICAALRHWRTARDLSPAMPATHSRLGRYRDLFERADPALAYLERARSLLPNDAEMAYFCGQARLESGDLAGACLDWRESIHGSEKYLPEILAQARPHIGPDGILRDILPDRPAILLKAADLLFPESERGSPARRLFLEKARDGLAAKTKGKTAAEWEMQARLEASLGHHAESVAAYRRAIGLSPHQTAWRIAYAEQLRQSGALINARRELETVLDQQPGNRSARDQLDVVKREIQLKEHK